MGMDRVSHDVAAKWRAVRWWGVDIGDPEVVVWGSPVELGAQDRIRQLRDALFRSRLLPAFQMSPAQMDGYLDEIRRLRPKMLAGYPSALARLAQRARDTGRDFSDHAPRVAFVTGEMLYEDQRRIIADAFHCPVANGYGARDAGFLAHECPAGGLHVGTEYIVMELVGADGQPVPVGTPGEVVVTHLASRDHPFVRYRTGDVAVATDAPCGCGRGLPLLERVEGRRNDWVLSRAGQLMHSASVTYVLRDSPGVRAFRVVQQKDLSLDVQVVEEGTLDEAVRRRIVEHLEARIGHGTPVRLQKVDDIPAEMSGKYRFVISHAVQ
jgi:phenylacetate-CoA ligase